MADSKSLEKTKPDSVRLPFSGERVALPPDFKSMTDLQVWASKNDIALREITEEQWTQRIEIEHELLGPHTGELRVTTERTGEAGISLCIDAAYRLFKDRYQSAERPPLKGEGRIRIEVQDGRLLMAFEPVANPNQVKSMLAVALFALIEQCAEGEFNPVGEMAGLLCLVE